MASGFICLHRELLEKPIWLNSTPEQKTILITLLLLANHKKKNWEWQGKKFECKEGQFITSAKSIEKACGDGISRQNIRTALVRFEKLEFLTMKTTKTQTLITIVNWRQYQDKELRANQQANQDLTNSQPTANQDLTTNNNVNNDNNDNKGKEKIYKKENPPKEKFAEFVSMTNDEYLSLVAEHGEEAAKSMIAILDNYKGSSGKKYKSDYRAILSWVKDKYSDKCHSKAKTNSNGNSHSKGFRHSNDILAEIEKAKGELPSAEVIDIV